MVCTGIKKNPAEAGECKGNHIQEDYNTGAEERKGQNERIGKH